MVYGKLFSLQTMFLVIIFFTILTNCMKQKQNNNVKQVKRIQIGCFKCFKCSFAKNIKNHFRTNKNISLYIFTQSMTEKSLSLILECLYEPMDIHNFIRFLNEIPHHAKIEDKLPYVHQRLTKIFFDFRFYNLNEEKMYTQNIIEYFYPQNSAFQTADLTICPISQLFVLKFSKNHTFSILLYKNGDLVFKSSVKFKKLLKGVLKHYSLNWTKNVFSINLLHCGKFLVLNLNLGIKILINCFCGESPIVEFYASPLDNLKKYFRASPYLGFSQIEFYNQTLAVEQLCWDKNKNLISSKQFQSVLKKKNLTNIDSILLQQFFPQQSDEDDSDDSDHEEYLHTKSIKIMIKNK